MRISVVIPVRDGERYIVEAVDSVLAEPEVDEIVVVDDGSTDATTEVLSRYDHRVRVIRQEPTGQPAALNRGIENVRGHLVAFQDADDVWVGGRMALLLDALGPELDGVFGWIEQFLSPDLDPADAARLRIDQAPQASYLISSLLIRREAMEVVGPFVEDLTTSANIDWISRSREAGLRTVVVPTVVTRRRIHASNLGRRAAATRNTDLLRVVRSHVERQRGRDT